MGDRRKFQYQVEWSDGSITFTNVRPDTGVERIATIKICDDRTLVGSSVGSL